MNQLDVMPWRDHELVLMHFFTTLWDKEGAIMASYAHRGLIFCLVPESIGNHEDTVDLVLTEPRLHDNLYRENHLHIAMGCYRNLGATVTRRGLDQNPDKAEGKQQSNTKSEEPNHLAGSAVFHQRQSYYKLPR